MSVSVNESCGCRFGYPEPAPSGPAKMAGKQSTQRVAQCLDQIAFFGECRYHGDTTELEIVLHNMKSLCFWNG